MFKSGFVAVVGSPNAGKSTFINTVVGKKISIVSDKVQTTRDMIRGIYNDEEAQIVFLDTPGFHKPRNKLNVYMNQQIEMSLKSTDIILYIIDAKYGLGKKEQENIQKISEIKNVKKIVVLNKIDIITPLKVERIVQELDELKMFDAIIPVSLKEKFNQNIVIKNIKDYLVDEVKYYDEDTFSDYTDEFFVEEIIREKILQKTNEEVPHSIGVKVTNMENEKNILVISATIYVERDSQKGIIIGRAGKMLQSIGTAARKELKIEFNQPIYLDLHVKVLSNWGQKIESLNTIGYDTN